MSASFSRRQIIRSGFLAACASSVNTRSQALELFGDDPNTNGNNEWMNFKMGIASYTFRKFSLEQTIKALQRLNLHYISIKDFHLALTSTTSERKAAVQKFKDAGITPLSCGNI